MSNLSIMMDSKDYYFCLRLCENFKSKFYKNQKIIVKKIKEDLLNFLQPSIKNKKRLQFYYKVFRYETNYRNINQLKKLKLFSLKNKVNLVDTSELIKYMSKNINRLKKL